MNDTPSLRPPCPTSRDGIDIGIGIVIVIDIAIAPAVAPT